MVQFGFCWKNFDEKVAVRPNKSKMSIHLRFQKAKKTRKVMWISVAEKSVRENLPATKNVNIEIAVEREKRADISSLAVPNRHDLMHGHVDTARNRSWKHSQDCLSRSHTPQHVAHTQWQPCDWEAAIQSKFQFTHTTLARSPIHARNIGTFPLRTHTPSQRPDWLCRGAVRVALQCGGLSYSVLSSSLLVLIWLYNQIITAYFNALVFHVRANRSGRMMMVMMTTAAAEVTTMTMAHMRYPTKAVC